MFTIVSKYFLSTYLLNKTKKENGYGEQDQKTIRDWYITIKHVFSDDRL